MNRIDFITLNRSDYATIRPVILAALEESQIESNVIVGGSHLLERFGNSLQSIIEDDIPISHKIHFMNESDNSEMDIAASYNRAINKFVDYFSSHTPDYVFIVGDRWEMLAVASAANMCRIPIMHHSGGDITQGSRDNQIRYVLTTLSHLHLVALEQHQERLIKMGEEPWRIRVTGEPALSYLKKYAEAVPEVREKLGISSERFALATFHPTSYEELTYSEQIEMFILTLDLIDIPVLITAPNPDPGNRQFFDRLSNYADSNNNVTMHSNLGTETYYAAMDQACFMIGNSSSGLWEAPSFSLPVVNIGSRQDGRIKGSNVINARMDIDDIKRSILEASSDEFHASIQDCDNPYVKDDTLQRILTILKTDKEKSVILSKKFIDPLCT